MTANSFTSVSLDPPLILVCIDRHAATHDRILSMGAFAVSVLGAGQERVARHFADPGRSSGTAQFEAVACFPGQHTGAPLISGALAWLECRLWRTYDGGDHSIFLGHLLAAHSRTAPDALVFLRGRYDRLAAAADDSRPSRGTAVTAWARHLVPAYPWIPGWPCAASAAWRSRGRRSGRTA